MNEYQITYTERKDHCCPPSSYRQENIVTVLAENQDLAIKQITGNEIEVSKIESTN
jgi:hypothetical protein